MDTLINVIERALGRSLMLVNDDVHERHLVDKGKKNPNKPAVILRAITCVQSALCAVSEFKDVIELLKFCEEIGFHYQRIWSYAG